jgi:hypothetical protein
MPDRGKRFTRASRNIKLGDSLSVRDDLEAFQGNRSIGYGNFYSF